MGELEVKKNSDSSEMISLKNKIKEMGQILEEKEREIGQKQKNY